MSIIRVLRTGKIIERAFYLCLVLPVGLVSAYGQKIEITPLVGARFGGTMELEQASTPNFVAHLADSISFGIAGGYRFEGEDEGHDIIGFRWMRQNTHLGVKQDPLAPILVPTPLGITTSFRPAVHLDHFLGDFTHEFALEDAPSLQPFVSASVGAVRMSAPASSATRFSFGVGACLKVFPSRHWGFSFKAEYLPTVLHAELQRLVCVGGCIFVLNGGIMNQFEVTVGPAFRF